MLYIQIMKPEHSYNIKSDSLKKDEKDSFEFSWFKEGSGLINKFFLMKYFLLSIFVMGMMVFPSCTDEYLDVDHYFADMLTVDSAFTKKNYTEQWLWSTYSFMKGNGAEIADKGSIALNFASDDAIFGDWDNLCRRYQNGEYSASDLLQENRWGHLYQGIRKASTFIYNVDNCEGLSLNEREDMRAQARFLRAYFYWMLMKQWGPVPIMPEQGQDISLSYEELSVTRSSYDECVEYVVAVLEQAARVLPVMRPSSWLGQATRGAALATRAKVLLYAASPFYNGNTEFFDLKDNQGRTLISQTYSEEKWARAAAAAKEVIDLGVYDLFTMPLDTASTVPLPDNVPSANYPNGAGGIDPFLSYQHLFSGEVNVSNNPELIFFRQNYTDRDLVSLALHSVPFTLGGWNTVAATKKQAEAYYMRDGRKITNPSAEYPHITEGFTTSSNEQPYLPGDVSLRYANREARFYASIAFNGSIWENLSTTETSKRESQICYY
jgi:hypothetical protein